MNILINASNLRKGGGIQVADSICRELNKYPQCHFWVVYPEAMIMCARLISKYKNVDCVLYNMPMNLWGIITCSDKYLDYLVKEKSIDAVLTIFGPSRWKPAVAHLSGFAISHLVLKDSPYWKIIGWKTKVRQYVKLRLLKYSFDKCSNCYYTENPYISKRLSELYPFKRIFTITNNANQVFYDNKMWNKGCQLPSFNGFTFLTIASDYQHKNLRIVINTIKYIKKKYPNLSFRFVFSIYEENFKDVEEEVKKYIVFIGPVTIDKCPYLYEQSDAMFLPTLLECFSASYAEAMVMRKPILTTDLDFSRSICGDAALYYEATSPYALGEAMYKMITDAELRKKLVEKGLCQLENFDNYEERTRKLIKVIEELPT